MWHKCKERAQKVLKKGKSKGFSTGIFESRLSFAKEKRMSDSKLKGKRWSVSVFEIEKERNKKRSTSSWKPSRRDDYLICEVEKGGTVIKPSIMSRSLPRLLESKWRFCFGEFNGRRNRSSIDLRKKKKKKIRLIILK